MAWLKIKKKTDAETAASLPPSFTRLWLASGVSYLGDGIYLSALPLLAASLTTDPFTLSLVTSAAVIPWLLFGLLGGALVDRWDRRRTMMTADLVRALALMLLPLSALLWHISLPVLIGVAFSLGTAQIFFDSASTAYLRQLLDGDVDLIQRALARNLGAQTTLSQFIGPPLGSALFALARTVPYVLNALSYVGSALFIRTLPQQPVDTTAAKGPLWRGAKEGALFVLRNRVLLSSTLRFMIGNVAFMAGEAVLVLFAHQCLHLGKFGFGVLLTAQAVGGLAGAGLARTIGTRLGTGGALIFTAAVEGVAQLGLGLSSNAVFGAVALALTGTAMSATMVIAPSVSMAIVPAQLTGRVSATRRLGSLGAAPLGAAMGGWLGSAVGLRAPFIFGAALLFVVTALTAVMAPSREIEAALAAAQVEQQPEPVSA